MSDDDRARPDLWHGVFGKQPVPRLIFFFGLFSYICGLKKIQGRDQRDQFFFSRECGVSEAPPQPPLDPRLSFAF